MKNPREQAGLAKCCRTGAPILRPLFFHYPSDAQARCATTRDGDFSLTGSRYAAGVLTAHTREGKRRACVRCPAYELFDRLGGG